MEPIYNRDSGLEILETKFWAVWRLNRAGPAACQNMREVLRKVIQSCIQCGRYCRLWAQARVDAKADAYGDARTRGSLPCWQPNWMRFRRFPPHSIFWQNPIRHHELRGFLIHLGIATLALTNRIHLRLTTMHLSTARFRERDCGLVESAISALQRRESLRKSLAGWIG